ncbi:MAG: hypothetical protein E7385_03515 [Ruminococcaceae bacterium]|nr:hypothetical protein [Oscillospiraceae bacterium]
MKIRESDITPSLNDLDERATAYQKCMIFMRQAYPNSAVMTYDNNHHRGADHVLLAKFVIGLGETSPTWITYDECTPETIADNIPGGLHSQVKLENGDEPFTATWRPLLYASDTIATEGAGLLHIHSDSPRRFWLKFGNGNIAFMHFSPNENMKGSEIDCQEGYCEIKDDCVIVRRKERKVITSVHGAFDSVSIEKRPDTEDGYGTYAVVSSFGSDIYVTVGFSEDECRAVALSKADPICEEKKVIDYYDDLLSNWKLNTPDPILNEAFDHALLNVEYAWLYPFGWIESIQHWPTMWHMEHTAAEEWNGRYDRVRRCLRSQMEHVFPNGAIPDMCTNNTGRRDWGGNNQFFLREVEHYVKMTGDLEFAAECEPFMEKALWQTFAEYDPTDDGVIAWGTQIGNQEDFESTPGKGASTGIEGVQMLTIMAYIKKLLGKEQEAAAYEKRAARCLAKWHDTVWLKDLGRPAWYEDINGELRLETTYHGITYPVIYNKIDDADKVSALDHLVHRLSGPEGEIYQTNHFGDHCYDWVPTWGMQCGSDMQPFATFAYALAGMKNQAVKPLAFIAKRVCSEYQRGAWPETANEKRFAYFSPSAAVFSQGIIESIFGLKRDKIENTTTISPAICDSWPYANLKLPEAELAYTAIENGFTLNIRITDSTVKKVNVMCPPAGLIKATVNGNTVCKVPEQHCGWSSAEFELGTDGDITVTCTWDLINIKCEYQKSIACSDKWQVRVSGDATLVGIDDRCGVLADYTWESGILSGNIRENLMDKYEKYGWFGITNFARRMVYLKLRYKDQTFLYPCPITVLPKISCSGKLIEADNIVEIEVRNQLTYELTGEWHLIYNKFSYSAQATVGARDKAVIRFEVPEANDIFSPGKNKAYLAGPAGSDVIIEARVANANVISLPLNDAECKPLLYWKEIGLHPSHGHMMQGPDHFMKDLWETYKSIDMIDGVPLPLNPNGFIPFSREKHPVVTIPLDGKKMKKIYILCSAFIDNHDVFSKLLTVEAEAEKKDAFIRPIYRYDVYHPGNIDMGYGNPVIAGFATYVNGTDRSITPDFPTLEQADYDNVQPPQYPQRYLWCDSKAIDCCNTVFNLLEIDFGEHKEMKELRILPCETDAAGGIYAIAAHIE